MQLVKLQLGCLLVIAYIEVTYIRATLKGKIPCNAFFDALMAVAPWAVVFDGITAWTVNHMDTVPELVNRGAHLLFFILMDLTVIITSMYIYDQLLGFRNKKRECLLMGIPGAISQLLIIGGIGRIVYIQGKTTWYSAGFSVYVCYAVLFLYYGYILYIAVTRRRFVPREKMLGTLSLIGIVGLVLLAQIFRPELLFTAVLPTFLLLGFYIDFENPSIRKVIIQHNEMVDGFATMVESRDNNTGGHIKRTRAYVDLMLEKLRHNKRFRGVLSRDYAENVSNAAPLHDIGKIASPDSILQKPGKLTDEEYEIMKRHAADGGEIILQTFQDMNNAEFRQIAYEVARYHHEKYDGSGYPEGLKGEAIPLHARIMAIADVFDAVSQRRCYREAMPLDDCFAIIEKGSGTDFDPEIAGVFLAAKDEVVRLISPGGQNASPEAARGKIKNHKKEKT